MFKPIVHNLQPHDAGYGECELYNRLIENKPTGDMTLAKKVALQRAWKDLCNQALMNAHKATLGKE